LAPRGSKLFCTLLGALAVAAAPGAPQAQEVAPASAPLADVRGLDRAIWEKDGDSLQRLLADDMVWVSGSGLVRGKQAFIENLTGEALVIAPFAPEQTRLYQSPTLEVWTGQNAMVGTSDGESFIDRHRFVDVWEKQGDEWRLVYIQVTRLPAEPNDDD
jgi:ketosteroid isomerase-like protein